MPYFGVEKVEELGTPYDFNYFAQQKLLTTGEHDVEEGNKLVMVLDNSVYKIAPDVTKPSELKYFLELYNKGHYLDYKLFKLDEDKAKECPDTGRFYNPGFEPK